MKNYLVKVTHTLVKSIIIQAEDGKAALAKGYDLDFDGEIILDDIDDFAGSDWEIDCPIEDENLLRLYDYYPDDGTN